MHMPNDPMRRWRISRRAQRLLRKRLGVRRSAAYRIVSAGAVLTAPGEFLRRRRAAARLLAEAPRPLTVPQADGFLAFGADALPGVDVAVESCRKIWESVRSGTTQVLGLRDGYSKQDFLLPVLHADGATLQPALLDFVLSPAVLATVAGYFGAVPVLTKIHILWTKPNSTAMSSQLFHMDAEDTTELKLFVHVFDVDETAGPFTLIPAATSQRIKRHALRGGPRVEPERMRANCPETEWIAITGAAGSGVFVDTARCFHFGSRENQRDRLMLMAQFIPYFGANFKAVEWRPGLAAAGRELDPLERMLMPV
jgi:hypothetical protein